MALCVKFIRLCRHSLQNPIDLLLSKNLSHFMQIDISLSCSQQSTTYTALSETNPVHSLPFLMSHCNSIRRYIPKYSARFLLLKSRHQKPSIYTPSSSNVPHVQSISSSFISPPPPPQPNLFF